MINIMKALWVLTLLNTGLLVYLFLTEVPFRQSSPASETPGIPNLLGTWKGTNLTVSNKKGYKEWGEKTIFIIEQKDRRFKGHFSYPDGTKNFFGVIYPDNISITWVAENSHGYNHGRILDVNTIGACYVESWEEATAGCAELSRRAE